MSDTVVKLVIVFIVALSAVETADAWFWNIPDCSTNGPVCGRNEQSCKRFASVCDRVKFNCRTHCNYTPVNASFCRFLPPGQIGTCAPRCVTRFCPQIFDPVCGRWGRTCRKFSNRCEMNNYNCRTSSRFREVPLSRCPSALNVNGQCL